MAKVVVVSADILYQTFVDKWCDKCHEETTHLDIAILIKASGKDTGRRLEESICVCCHIRGQCND